MDNTERDKKSYELAILVKTEGELSGIAAIVGQHSAELVGELVPKKIALAYPIQKQKEGIFAYGTFRAYPEDAKKLEEDLRTRKDVLRFMILVLKANAMAAVPGTALAPRRRPMGPGGSGGPMGSGTSGIALGRPSTAVETRPAPGPLSNEALEKKISEILQ